MYRGTTHVKTGVISGGSDGEDTFLNFSSSDGYGFDKIVFYSTSTTDDYLINMIRYDKPKASSGSSSVVNELANASAQDISALTGSYTVNDRDVGNTITASIVGSPVVKLNGQAFTLPSTAQALVANGAFTIGPSTRLSTGSGTPEATPVSWSYDPTAVDLDFLSKDEQLTISYSQIGRAHV